MNVLRDHDRRHIRYAENRKKAVMKKTFCLFALAAFLLCGAGLLYGQQYWDFPPLPPPHKYGDILISQNSGKSGVKAVYFSHWSHRAKYSCRVCHYELEFSFAVNQTDITEKENQAGFYCGACHNGDKLFGHTEEHCDKCHTGKLVSDRDRFVEIARFLPRSQFGNHIDWSRAVMNKRMTPVYSIFKPDEKPLGFRKKLTLEAEWTFVPPAYFSHEVHARWLDCANCHPDIFNIKKKTTRHFSMKYILEKKFCGVCHLKIAFPLNNCTRCHPEIKLK